MIIPMESIYTPKRIIKKQLKNVNKAIIEIAETKFVNIEEKEEKIRYSCFVKESNIEEGREVRNKITIYIL